MSRTSKSIVITVIVVVVVAVLGLIYASPYIALDRLKRAADARDAQTVNQYVDFPSLRESLKDQVGQLLTRKIDTQKSGNPLAMIGAMIGAALIGPLVDSYATPDGVAALLNGIPPRGDPGEKPPVPSEANSAAGAAPGTAPAPQPAMPAQPAPTAAAPSAPSAPKPPPQTTAGYRSFDTFAVNYQHGAGDARYSAILRRYGLFSWKLVAVELNG
jgi:flagellar basal body-associated protein FliL